MLPTRKGEGGQLAAAAVPRCGQPAKVGSPVQQVAGVHALVVQPLQAAAGRRQGGVGLGIGELGSWGGGGGGGSGAPRSAQGRIVG